MATVQSSLAPILETTPEIEAAWERWAVARVWMGLARQTGGTDKEIRTTEDAAIETWRELERAIPIRAGFYRLGDQLVGWDKVSKGGFELVRRAAAWSLDHPDGRRWRERHGMVSKILSHKGASR